MLLAAGAEINNPAANELGGSLLDIMCPYESPEPICQHDKPGNEEDMRLHSEYGEGFRTTHRLLETAGAMEDALLDMGTPEIPTAGLRLLLAAQCGDAAAAQAALAAGVDKFASERNQSIISIRRRQAELEVGSDTCVVKLTAKEYRSSNDTHDLHMVEVTDVIKK